MAVAGLNHILGAWPWWAGVLGQTARTAQARSDIWWNLGLLTAMAAMMVVIGLIARKLLADPIESSNARAVFSLSDLRRLHREGQLSDEEFQAAKAAVIAGTSAQLKDDDAPQTPAKNRAPLTDDTALGPELLDPSAPPDRPAESDNPPGIPPKDKPGNPA